jgi:hypothetical protein
MRSIISSIWRAQWLAGGAQSQVCRLEPTTCGALSAVRHRIIKLDCLVDLLCELRLMLSPGGRNH